MALRRRLGTSPYVLFDPQLHEGVFSSIYHNFWKRGHTFYLAGKFLDCHWLPDLMSSYRAEVGLRLASASPHSAHVMPPNARSFYNSMQLQKLWESTDSNVLDRERAMMANITMALELCLKAMTAHANYRESGRFSFTTGHDVARLYKALPGDLRDEIAEESKVFARDYLTFRSRVEEDISRMDGQFFRELVGFGSSQQFVADWEEIAARMKSTDYSAFLSSNDPGTSGQELHQDWLDEALRQTKRSRGGFGDVLQYYRYAPSKDRDELPTEGLHRGLLLGRFFLEHLFPLPPDPDKPLATGLLA